MKKAKKRFVCKECGYVSSSWIGKCPDCLSWNSFIEEIINNLSDHSLVKGSDCELSNINDIQQTADDFILSNISDLNLFFGDGIVSGSIILLAGEPGIGKSTFLLYLTLHLPLLKKIIYFSGEESKKQIKKRCDRLKMDQATQNLYLTCQCQVEMIIEQCEREKPELIFIDSIQTMFSKSVDSLPGTLSQIKQSANQLIQYAKSKSICIIIIGHVTKSGEIAGPKILEHMVDVVLYFENNYRNQYRVLRSMKNRFGSIDELLIFEMKKNGLSLVENLGDFFIDKNPDAKNTGKCKTVIIEGQRPLIIEVESLVVPSMFPNPRRFSEGVDVKRINRIAAILDKHVNENLNNYDIYFNISGGIRTNDVAVDLAIAVSIFSSKNKIEILNNQVFIGELSLTGKIRDVYKQEYRIKECEKFGFNPIFTPKELSRRIDKIKSLKND